MTQLTSSLAGSLEAAHYFAADLADQMDAALALFHPSGSGAAATNDRRLVDAAPHTTEQRRSGWGRAWIAAGGAGLAMFAATRRTVKRTSVQPQNVESLAMDMAMGTSVV